MSDLVVITDDSLPIAQQIACNIFEAECWDPLLADYLSPPGRRRRFTIDQVVENLEAALTAGR